MGENLKIPPESEQVKNTVLYMWLEIGQARLGDSSAIDLEREGVWSGKILPEYLWDQWEDELSKKGFTKRKFLRLMKYRVDDILLWTYDRIHWRELIDRIVESMDTSI
jgi:hypothetical protein